MFDKCGELSFKLIKNDVENLFLQNTVCKFA